VNWIQVITIIGANFGLTLTMFLWIRKEANADRRELAGAILSFKDTVLSESKDFHGRLCAIEEKMKK
jgi:hypothetical protein